MSFLGSINLVDPSEVKRVRPTMEGIEATTMTGQQRELIDGIVHETMARESHKGPGMAGKHEGSKVPTLKSHPTATVRTLGMIHLRGTR
jgi:hypothetical protein